MKKAFFIMIFFLLAALFGAAQEAIVVYEGATTNHFVENHKGSNYKWDVYISFSPDIKAPPDDYQFITSGETNTVQVQWNNSGTYYLKVTEADLKGCENLKVLPVMVTPANRSIGFLTLSGNSCYSETGNGFSLPLSITGDNGKPMETAYFPVLVEIKVDNQNYTQLVQFDNQVIQINDDWVNADPQKVTVAQVEIIDAKDVQNNDIPPDSATKTYKRTINALSEIKFVTSPAVVKQGDQFIHEVQMITGNQENAVYEWSVDPVNGTSTDLSSFRGNTATITWNGEPGNYLLKVYVTDGNGCASEQISQSVEIIENNPPAPFEVYAGPDTIIGSCQLYKFSKVTPADNSYIYSWEPAIYLSNPDIPDPVFTPGETTSYVLSVTSPEGITVKDTVTITVQDVIADAGEDMFMMPDATAILNGSASSGKNITYQWATAAGKIESGANTANPVISGFGDYYLTVTDEFGCTDKDTVKVTMLTQAPVAVDDFDTTSYQRETIINVLANDTDPQNNLDASTLSISNPPFNGTAYVDFDTHLVHYRPNNNFQGTDIFEYRICNKQSLCDNATVNVLVTDFNFLIPNAFSPNGDGINDYFEILGIEYYENNKITIINRWGNKVYEASGYGISTNPVFWDGKPNTGFGSGNNDLPTGTYYYILDLGNGQQPISGSIYIDR